MIDGSHETRHFFKKGFVNPSIFGQSQKKFISLTGNLFKHKEFLFLKGVWDSSIENSNEALPLGTFLKSHIKTSVIQLISIQK